MQVCNADAVFNLVRRATPYRDLTRLDFDDCLAYLGCCDANSGTSPADAAWLPPRLRGEPMNFTILNARTARLLRRNIGTILAEPVYEVWTRGVRPDEDVTEETLIGQVDRAFAERLRGGDRFLLDGRCLQVRALLPEESRLLVEDVAVRPLVPRWGGDGWPLSTELAQRLFLLRALAADALRDGPEELEKLLREEYGLCEAAIAKLEAYFQRQECHSEIPDPVSCLIEIVAQVDGMDCYIHTPLNRLGNDALARVAVHRLARDFGCSCDSLVADLGFALLVHGDPRGSNAVQTKGDAGIAEVLRTLLTPANFETDLDAALEGSAALRERFQRVAQTALMLLRQPLGQKPRVGGANWGARRLFDKVRAHDKHFVLLRQTLSEVRAECCDAAAAVQFVHELETRPLRCRWLAYPSPFAESWTQLADGAAEQVHTPAEALLRLHAALTEGTSDAR